MKEISVIKQKTGQSRPMPQYTSLNTGDVKNMINQIPQVVTATKSKVTPMVTPKSILNQAIKSCLSPTVTKSKGHRPDHHHSRVRSHSLLSVVGISHPSR